MSGAPDPNSKFFRPSGCSLPKSCPYYGDIMITYDMRYEIFRNRMNTFYILHIYFILTLVGPLIELLIAIDISLSLIIPPWLS